MNHPLLAACEPSKQLQAAIQADLNIKGQLSLPQAIDMRAILPVYAFSPQKTPLHAWFASGIFPCAGFNNFAFNLLPTGLNLAQISSYKLSGLFIRIAIDVAGRAALAVAPGEVILVTFLHLNTPVGGPVIAVCTHHILANPAQPLNADVGSFNMTHLPNVNFATAQWEQDLVNFKDYTLLPNEFLHIEITLQNGGLFPLNSTTYVNAVFEYSL